MLMARAGSSSSSSAADVEDQRRKYLKDDDFAYDTREGEMNEEEGNLGHATTAAQHMQGR